MARHKSPFIVISTMLLASACAAEDPTVKAEESETSTAPVSSVSAPDGDVTPAELRYDPSGDAMTGRQKFVTLGCVQCHAVGGVGGRVAPSFDAPTDGSVIDPVDFASWMWEGADMMVPLQEMELGYEITLNGQDLRDLAAFASSPEAQSGFSLDEIPLAVQDRIMGEIDMSDTSSERYDGQEWHGSSPFAITPEEGDQ